LWTEGPGRLSEDGRALVTALSRLDEDGIDPRAYRVELDEGALARAFLDAYEHLMRGRVAPESVYRDGQARRRSFDPGDALERAATRGPAAALRGGESFWVFLVPGVSRRRLVTLAEKYDQENAVVYAGPETDGRVVALLRDGDDVEGGAPTPEEIARVFSAGTGTHTLLEYVPQGLTEGLCL
jgi:hypothetical protein